MAFVRELQIANDRSIALIVPPSTVIDLNHRQRNEARTASRILDDAVPAEAFRIEMVKREVAGLKSECWPASMEAARICRQWSPCGY
jgi:hypothetical protein